MKKLWQFCVRHTFWALLKVLRFLPWKIVRIWGNALGALGYRASARYRNVGDKNLRLAYGDAMDERGRRRLIKRVFQNFSCSLFEFLKAPSLSDDEVRRRVPVSDEIFARTKELVGLGKGMILITGHIGNWEMLARRGALEGYQFAVVARQSPDIGLNGITDYIRQSGGYEVYARGNSAKLVLQRLRKGGIVAILPDQKSEDVFVPFFGRLTGTVAGPAVLALKTGAPILMLFCLRMPNGMFKIEMGPDIDITPSGNLEADTQRIMTEVTAGIEDIIRRYPDQWLWLHDRWRAPVPAHLQKAVMADAPHS